MSSRRGAVRGHPVRTALSKTVHAPRQEKAASPDARGASALAVFALALVGAVMSCTTQLQAQTLPWPTDRPQVQPTAPWPASAAPVMAAPAPQPAPAPAPMGAAPGGATAAPAGGAFGNPPPCVAQFGALRAEVEKRAGLAKQASERKASREEMCKLVTAYANAEAKWVKFAKDNKDSCGIPQEVVKQLQGVHARTANIRKQLCAAGPVAGAAPTPSLSDALGTTRLPAPETTTTRRGGTLDTLTGNPIR